MKKQLIELKKALKGFVVMSEDLDTIANSLHDNIVPIKWSNCFLSLKPLASWTVDLNDRVSFLRNWVEKGTPCVFWISGFSFP